MYKDGDCIKTLGLEKLKEERHNVLLFICNGNESEQKMLDIEREREQNWITREIALNKNKLLV